MRLSIVFLLALHTCIVENYEYNTKIINGETATDGQFPHMVQISIKTSESAPQYCGGSLLNDRWVLTAAHCFKKMHSAKAYLGSTFWRTMPVKMNIIEVIIHPSYINVNADDIALVKLERPVNFTDTIKPVSLPDKAQNQSTGVLFVPGFGDTKNSSQSMLYLRFVRMKKITNEECSKMWQWKINDSQLCTVGQAHFNHTTCRGDSGSGVVQFTENNAVILGIVSYGAPGCLGKPKVFTRVSFYLDFIYAVMNMQ